MPPKRRFSTLRTALLGRNRDQDHPIPQRQPEVTDEELRQTFPPNVRTSLSELGSYINLSVAPKDSGSVIKIGSIKSVHKFTPSHSHSIGQNKQRMKQKVTTASSEDVTGTTGRQHFYAGVTHSDLDIQKTRPPLMYQMDIITWLWLQSSQAHRVILMILASLLFIIIANLVFGSIILAEHKNSGNPYICKTKACRALGKRLLSTLNKSVDPCEDFYAFVCGRSDFIEDATQEERDFWSFHYRGGRILYDFHRSVSLGKMFKKTTKFPENQILPYYKSCLDVVAREDNGLQPFYDALKKFGLYDVEKDKAHTAEQVIHGIAFILGHDLKTCGIIRDIYGFNAQRPTVIFTSSLSMTYLTGKVSMYGYQTYKDTVKNAFLLLSELHVNTDELNIIAHDIVCLELLLRDRVVVNGSDVIMALKGDPVISGLTCDYSNGSTIPANFGKKPDGNFNYTLLLIKMHDLINPGSESSRHLPALASSHAFGIANKKFLDDFELVFNHSAPYRLLRYLQWRLFYSLSSDLNQDATNTMFPIKRHFFTGVPYCIQRLFNRMPFVAPERFMQSLPDAEMVQIDKEFNVLMERIRTAYYKVITRSQFKLLQAHLGRDFTERERNLLREVLIATMRTDDVLPVAYDNKNFPRYSELYKGISLENKSFVENTLILGYRFTEWRLVPKYMDIFYSINSQLQIPVWVDKLQSVYNPVAHKFNVYLPFASAEQPFFRDGLIVSDFSGTGLLYAEAIERASFSFLTVPDNTNDLEHYLTAAEHSNLLAEGYTLQEIRNMIKILKDFSLDYFLEKYLPTTGRWRKGSHSWNNFTYDISLKEITAREEIITLTKDQRRWQVIGVMMQEFLSSPHNWKHRKARLEGLEEYDAEKIFYMSQVNRRCQRLVKEKYDHTRKYGPLLDSIRNNEVLSNLYHFSETFKCEAGSFMNPTEEKIYFWDVDVNISNYHFNESQTTFFNNE